MSFGRKNVKLNFRGKLITPEYLNPKAHREIVEETIGFYEENLGRRLGEIDWKILDYTLGDDRLAAALKHVMRRFYRPTPPPRVRRGLRELRAKIFEYVNLSYGGYLNSKIRSRALKEIGEKFGLKGDVAEEIWLDERENWRLERVKKPTIEEVVEHYNLEVIDTLATHSTRAEIDYEAEGSEVAKIIGRKCKLLGLVYDGRRTLTRKIHFTISGPGEVFGKPTRYGSRIALLIAEAAPHLYRLRRWNVTLHVKYPRRSLNVTVLSDSIKPSIPKRPTIRVREAFDSEVEKRIYWTLKSLKLRVEREPEPIVSGGLMFIPDFKIDMGNTQVYVEVVGYWRREYLEKKAYKLAEASKMGINLVVIADEKAKKHLEALKLPTIYYTVRSGRPVLPYGTLMRILRRAS